LLIKEILTVVNTIISIKNEMGIFKIVCWNEDENIRYTYIYRKDGIDEPPYSGEIGSKDEVLQYI
jgi:hypothetical protein